MPYSKAKGSIIVKPSFIRDAPRIKVGASPIITLQDTETGDQCMLGYNPPCIVPGCIGLWDFSDASSAGLYDKSRAGNNLLLYNTWTPEQYKDSIFGASYTFNSNNYTGIVDNFSVGGAFTIEVLLRIITDGSDKWIIDFDQGGQYGCYLMQVGGNDFRFSAYGTEISSGFIVGDQIDKWVHLAGTYDGTSLYLYINGKKWNSGTASSQDLVNKTLTIAARNDGSSPADYEIAAVRICLRALRPYEFIHHWYFNSIVGGYISSNGAVLFNDQISTFRSGKVFTVQADWNSENSFKSSNIIVNGIRGIPDEGFVQSQKDFSKLVVGGTPYSNSKTVGMWVFDGSLTSEGKVVDWSANSNPADLIGLTEEDLVNTYYGRYYETDTSKYVSIPNNNMSLDFLSGDATIDILVSIPDTSLDTVLLSRFEDENNFLILKYNSTAEELEASIKLGGAYIHQAIAGWSPIQENWYHIAWAIENGLANHLFVDGVEAALTTDIHTGGNILISAPIEIAKYDTSFSGLRMAFLRVSSCVMTSDEASVHGQCLFKGDISVQDLLLPS